MKLEYAINKRLPKFSSSTRRRVSANVSDASVSQKLTSESITPSQILSKESNSYKKQTRFKEKRQLFADAKLERLHLHPQSRWSYDPQPFSWKYFLDKYLFMYTRAHKISLEMCTAYVDKLTEDVLLMIRDLVNSRSYSDTFVAILHFLKLRHNEAIINPSFIQRYAEKLLNAYKDIVGLFAQSETPFTNLRSWISNFEAVRESPFFKKMYKFIMYILCHTVVTSTQTGAKFCSKIFEFLHVEATEKRKFASKGLDFMHCILDTIVFVLERGYQCFQTGSVLPLFHCGDTYTEWFDKCFELKRKSLNTTNCEVHGFTLYEFLNDLDTLIEKGESIAKHAVRVSGGEKNAIKSMLNELKTIRDTELTKKNAAQNRPAPFAVLLYGGSSVGKSSFTDILFTYYAKIHDLPMGAEYIYTRNPNDQFWSTFRTSQWGLKLDDIGYLDPRVVQGGDPSLLEMLQVVNNVPFVPAQADLADKGKTPVKSKFVVATTNTEHLNAKGQFSCPLAVQRRLPWIIDLQPKKEYAKNEVMLDPTKLSPLAEGEIPNYWNIMVKRVVPAGEARDGQMANIVEVKLYDNIDEFLQWFCQEALEHTRLQKQASEATELLHTLSVCKLCYKRSTICECLAPQSVMRQLDDGIRNREKVRSLSSLEKCSLYGYFMIGWKSLSLCYMLTLMSMFIVWKLPCFIFLLISCILSYFAAPTRCYFDPTYGKYILSIVDDVVWTNFVRHRVYLFGELVKGKLSHPYIFRGMFGALMATIVMCIYVLYPTLRKDDGNLKPESGRRPMEEKGEETFNPYYKDSFELSAFDVSRTSSSYKGLTTDVLLKMILKNCVYLKIRSFIWKKKTDQRAFCVGGHYYIVNKHAIPEGEFYVDVIQATSRDGVSQNQTGILVTPGMIKMDPDTDLAVIELRMLPPRKSFMELFPNNLVGRFKGVYIGRDEVGGDFMRTVHDLRYCADFTAQVWDMVLPAWCGKVETPTQVGDCGLVLLIQTSYGPALAGMHALGGGQSEVVAIALNKKTIEKLCAQFGHYMVQSGEPMLSAPGYERVLGPLDKKSPFRYIEEGTANIYGSFEGWRVSHTSAVAPTIMSRYLAKRGYSTKCGKPMMKGYIPWRTAALDLVNPVKKLNQDILRICAKQYTKEILEMLPKKELEKIHVYDDFTAINGAARIKFVDKMNRATSMGCPWKKSKKFFTRMLPPDGELMDPVEFTDDIKARCAKIEENYKNGIRNHPVYCGNLKDEALPFAKCECGKTRVFCGAPCDWCIVNRKYTLAFIRVMQRNSYVFEAAPGIVAQSTSWEKLYKYLTQHGEDRIVAGDYKAFDKRMPAPVILAAFDIIMDLCRAADWTEDDLRVLAGIAEDTAFPLVDFNGDLVEFRGSNPSGHPLTVIINCLANSLYNRYCYYESNPRKVLDTFRKHVKLMTYGDDDIKGISADCEFFNHSVMSQMLGDIGITYTMPDKSSDSVPFMNIADANFLKRKWRFDHDVGHYLAPLEHDSIEKSLMTAVVSKSVSFEHQCVDIISSAVREYFNYGRSTFETKRMMLQQVVSECNLSMYVNESTFPQYEQLKNEFLMSSGLEPQSKQSRMCNRCLFSDCDYYRCNQDDYFVQCILCLHCVDIGEDSCLCGGSAFVDFYYDGVPLQNSWGEYKPILGRADCVQQNQSVRSPCLSGSIVTQQSENGIEWDQEDSSMAQAESLFRECSCCDEDSWKHPEFELSPDV